MIFDHLLFIYLVQFCRTLLRLLYVTREDIGRALRTRALPQPHGTCACMPASLQFLVISGWINRQLQLQVGTKVTQSYTFHLKIKMVNFCECISIYYFDHFEGFTIFNSSQPIPQPSLVFKFQRARILSLHYNFNNQYKWAVCKKIRIWAVVRDTSGML